MANVEKRDISDKHDVPINSLLGVGKSKPLGYLPLNTLKKRTGENPNAILQKFLGQGLWARIYTKRESGIVSGALFVADLDALRELLDRRSEVLIANGWSSDPIEFIERTMKTEEPDFTPLFDLIADAYADYTNIGRTDVGAVQQQCR